MTLFDFSQSIRNLNREERFSEALQFFRENNTSFTPQQIGLNRYVVYEMITALIEINNYEAIFAFIEQHHVVLDNKNFSFLLKKFKNKPSVNWIVVDKFCDLVSPDKLSADCETREVPRRGQMVQMEFASDRENWYAFKTKALFEIKKYQECFEVSKRALEEIENFHYANDIWFARRIALSKKHLGNSADALNELLQILRRKKQWFIQWEVAEIYKESGEFNTAFKYAMGAINNFGDLEYKVGLLILIADILSKKQEKELSFKHYMLSKLLRQQKGWGVPQSLDFALQSSGYAPMSSEELPNLKDELKSYWSSLKPKQLISSANSNQQQVGKIDKILHNDERGADGFIKYDNKKSIYFRIHATDELTKRLNVGLEVRFKILSPKEDGQKERAVHLKLK